MDSEMKGYLKKVAARTLALLLAILLLCVSVFLLAFPDKASSSLAKMGMYSLSADFAKVAYNRSGDINDLAKLFDRSIKAEKHDMTVIFGEQLISSSDYSDYAQFRLLNFGDVYYKQYVLGEYAYARLCTKDSLNEILPLLEQDAQGEYVINCAYSYFVSALCTAKNEQVGEDKIIGIMESLEGIYLKMATECKEVTTIVADGYKLSSVYGLTEYADIWKARY